MTEAIRKVVSGSSEITAFRKAGNHRFFQCLMEKDPTSWWKLEDNVDYKPSEGANPEENGNSQVPSQEYHCYETDEVPPIPCC